MKKEIVYALQGNYIHTSVSIFYAPFLTVSKIFNPYSTIFIPMGMVLLTSCTFNLFFYLQFINDHRLLTHTFHNILGIISFQGHNTCANQSFAQVKMKPMRQLQEPKGKDNDRYKTPKRIIIHM